MKVSVFDFHCDTALLLMQKQGTLLRSPGHIDLQRAS